MGAVKRQLSDGWTEAAGAALHRAWEREYAAARPAPSREAGDRMEDKATKIREAGGVYLCRDANTDRPTGYAVVTSTTGSDYTVSFVDHPRVQDCEMWTCTCEWGARGRSLCAHVRALRQTWEIAQAEVERRNAATAEVVASAGAASMERVRATAWREEI